MGAEMKATTTGTSIRTYLDWLETELETKEWGEVGITFTVCRGHVTDVRKSSIDSEHYALPKQ